MEWFMMMCNNIRDNDDYIARGLCAWTAAEKESLFMLVRITSSCLNCGQSVNDLPS